MCLCVAFRFVLRVRTQSVGVYGLRRGMGGREAHLAPVAEEENMVQGCEIFIFGALEQGNTSDKKKSFRRYLLC